ncbi:MAG TPA: S8/S53 family peptidase [Streptosporangiaceae bacterium]|nr:S8/S53 family peptidase [Streptosporangiaceae bacterium]
MAARPWNAMVLDQVKYINEAFTASGQSPIHVHEDSTGGVLYMCAENEILVREEHSTDVTGLLNHPAEDVKWVARGVVRHTLVNADYTAVHEALGQIEANRGRGIAAPNHVLTVAPSGPCPATEPEEVPSGIEPYPAVQENGGEGVRIFIADTGLLEDTVNTCPWLAGVERAAEPDGAGPQPWEELPVIPPGPESERASEFLASQGAPPAAHQQATEAGQQQRIAGVGPELRTHGVAPSLATLAAQQEIKPYIGHGTFVAGVARAMAPRADVIVGNIFKTAGSALESDFVRELDRALDLGVDIFNLSITAPTLKDRPLLAFARWLERAQQYKGVVCVAAAGNSGQQLPSWPAACPEVVSVGALAADWRSRAEFSNYGGWVDVYAPGRDIVNAFATGSYQCYVDPYANDPPRKFYGMARWSGTSFSAPMVSGLIAARMSRTGENGREAATALLAEARSQAVPGTGPILLPYGNRQGT